jgi:hypothetical protein
MRFTRRRTLLAMLAIAVPALAAPSALAQTEPELHNQSPRLIVAQEVHGAADLACPAVVPTPPAAVSPNVTSGGCRVHVASVGNVPLVGHVSAGGSEVVVVVCQWEFDIRIDAAGEGWVTHQEFSGPLEFCTRQPCGVTAAQENRAYSFHMSEVEPPARTENAQLLFCTEPIGVTQPAHCEVTFPLSQTSTHRYSFVGNDVSGHGTTFPRCELSGTFNVEAALGTSGEGNVEQQIEIRHN